MYDNRLYVGIRRIQVYIELNSIIKDLIFYF